MTAQAVLLQSIQAYIKREVEPLAARAASLQKQLADAKIEIKAQTDAVFLFDRKLAEAFGATPTTKELAEMVAKEMPTPRDGKDGESPTVDLFALQSRVLEMIDVDAIAAKASMLMPTPRDGKDGSDGVNGAAGGQGAPGEDGRDGRDGQPGKDALSVTVIDSIDPLKKYQVGTFAKHAGGLLRAYRQTDPCGPSPNDASGWHVILDGVASVSLDTVGREFKARLKMTSGAEVVHVSKLHTMIHRGVWRESEFERGDVVTFGGSEWHAQADTKSKPGTSDEWLLVVKRGRDGKDFTR